MRIAPRRGRPPIRRTTCLLLAAAWLGAVLVPASRAGLPAPSLVATCADSGAVDVPDPHRSTFGLSAPVAGCQYRFRADGGFETLAVHVTLRDAFDTPISGAGVEVHLHGLGPGFCSCEGTVFVVPSDPLGVAHVSFSRLGGRGQLGLGITAAITCNSSTFRIAVGSTAVTFTTPDLDASCETALSTNIMDLGIFAVGLSTYVQYADYDCDLEIDIVDLGIWAHGLGRGCGP